jgi:glycine/D-amino acid oxidase-like deaminating enzyme
MRRSTKAIRTVCGAAQLSTQAEKPTATVIGSGVFGVSSAYFLSKQGYRVKVLDNRSAPGEGTSKGNASSLRTSTFGPMASPQMPRKVLTAIAQGDPLYRFSWKHVLTDPQLWCVCQ